MILDRRTMLTAGVSLLAGCGASRRSTKPLTIGYQRNGLLLLAKVHGGVDAGLIASGRPPAQWVEFPSGPPMMEAMRAGAIAFGTVGDSPPIFAQAAGAPILYVGVQPLTGESEGLLVPPRSTIRNLQDLRGRKVAFTKGSSSHLLVAKALRRARLAFKDVVAIELSPTDAVAAFLAGSIDAWATWDPYLALAQRDQRARILISGADLPASDAFYLANADFARQYGDDLRVLLHLLRLEAAWGQAHHDDLVTIVAKGSGLPAGIVETSLRRGPLSVEPLTPAVVLRQQTNADIFAGLGIISHRIEVSKALWHESSPTI